MTVDELRELAENADDCIVLVIPPPLSRGEKIRLCRTHGPLGDILAADGNGKGTVARFGAKEVVAWCTRMKARKQ